MHAPDSRNDDANEPIAAFFAKHPAILRSAMEGLEDDDRRRTKSGRLNALGIRELTAVVMDRSTTAYSRGQAAEELAHDASPACVEGVIAALQNRSVSIWSKVLQGLRLVVRDGRSFSRAFATPVFDALVPLVNRKGQDTFGGVASCLLMLNRDRAEALFQNAQFLKLNPAALQTFLNAALEAHVALPADAIHKLVVEYYPQRKLYPSSHIFMYSLRALAIAKDPRVEAYAEKILKSHLSSMQFDTLVDHTAQALAELKGAGTAWDHVLKQIDADGWRNLTIPQRTFYGAYWFNAEAENGGPSQYFFNEEPERILAAPDALKRVGAKRAAAEVQAGIKLFGPRGLNRTLEEKRAFMQTTWGRTDGEVDPWDRLRRKGKFENISAVAWIYAAKPADHFSGKGAAASAPPRIARR